MVIKVMFLVLVIIASFICSTINGRTLPVEKTAADVEAAFLHPHFPPYRGVFGGFRGGPGAGFGGDGAEFGGRYGSGGMGGRFGSDNESNAGGGTGTGGIGSLESGVNSGSSHGHGGGGANGDEIEGGLLPRESKI